MDHFQVYKDIEARTGGEIYLGVVGPVRTGKSTFIRRFMELLVIPQIADPNEQVRARDELPQAAAGKTIMTTEPKFIPKEAVPVQVGEADVLDHHRLRRMREQMRLQRREDRRVEARPSAPRRS